MALPLASASFEEEIAILVLFAYLNAGIAWYYYVGRKSEKYKDFQLRVIGSPPPPWPAPSRTTTTTRPAAAGESLSSPYRFHAAGVRFALKIWGFVTGSVLFWIIPALVLSAMALGELLAPLGSKVVACAYAAWERTWRRRRLWKARRRQWEEELVVDAPASAKRGETTTITGTLPARSSEVAAALSA